MRLEVIDANTNLGRYHIVAESLQELIPYVELNAVSAVKVYGENDLLAVLDNDAKLILLCKEALSLPHAYEAVQSLARKKTYLMETVAKEKLRIAWAFTLITCEHLKVTAKELDLHELLEAWRKI